MSKPLTLVRKLNDARASSPRASGARVGGHGGEFGVRAPTARTPTSPIPLVLAAVGALLLANIITPTTAHAQSAATSPHPVAAKIENPESKIENQNVPSGAVAIPAGTYVPLLRSANDPDRIAVAAFALDELPVTNAQFLAFVVANPKWQRSRVARLFADEHYLAHWNGDTALGPLAAPDAPVVRVSWFAARAYARWTGKRLPTTAEWEFAASAGYTAADGKNDSELNGDIYRWLARPTPDAQPSVTTAKQNFHGARGLHGLVWEWVADFNTAMVTGESRADNGLDRDLFCGSGSAGATDTSDYAAFMRLALRSSLKANNTTSSLGFRCAQDLPR